MKALFYDLEIENCIPQKQKRGQPEPVRESGLKYCKGWSDHFGMGLSCLGVYTNTDSEARVFDKHTLWEFFKLCEGADLLVSYNGVHFDNKVISAHGVAAVAWQHKCFDLRVALLQAAPDLRFKPGYKLGQICERTLGVGKTGEGALAPVLWQQGRYAEVMDYCLKDTNLVRRLFQHCLEGRPIAGLEGREIILPMPEEISSGIRGIGC